MALGGFRFQKPTSQCRAFPASLAKAGPRGRKRVRPQCQFRGPPTRVGSYLRRMTIWCGITTAPKCCFYSPLTRPGTRKVGITRVPAAAPFTAIRLLPCLLKFFNACQNKCGKRLKITDEQREDSPEANGNRLRARGSGRIYDFPSHNRLSITSLFYRIYVRNPCRCVPN